MWRVIIDIKNIRSGNVTQMQYLKEGTEMQAITSAAVALNEADSDPNWTVTVGIHIERIGTN